MCVCVCVYVASGCRVLKLYSGNVIDTFICFVAITDPTTSNLAKPTLQKAPQYISATYVCVRGHIHTLIIIP